MNKELQIIIEILTRKSGPDAAAELAKVREAHVAAGGDAEKFDATVKQLTDDTDRYTEALKRMALADDNKNQDARIAAYQKVIAAQRVLREETEKAAVATKEAEAEAARYQATLERMAQTTAQTESGAALDERIAGTQKLLAERQALAAAADAEIAAQTQISDKTKDYAKTLGETAAKTGKLRLEKETLKKAITALTAEFPLLGYAARLALNPVTALVLMAIYSVNRWREANKALSESSTPEFQRMTDAVEKQKLAMEDVRLAGEAYDRSLKRLATTGADASEVTAQYVASLERRAGYEKALDDKRQSRAVETITEAERLGIISHEQAAEAKFQIDQAYARKRIELENKVERELLAAKFREAFNLNSQNETLKTQLPGMRTRAGEAAGRADISQAEQDVDKNRLQATNQKIAELEAEIAQMGNPIAVSSQYVLKVRKQQLIDERNIAAGLEKRILQEAGKRFDLKNQANRAAEDLSFAEGQLRDGTSKLATLKRQLPAEQTAEGENRKNRARGALEGTGIADFSAERGLVKKFRSGGQLSADEQQQLIGQGSLIAGGRVNIEGAVRTFERGFTDPASETRMLERLMTALEAMGQKGLEKAAAMKLLEDRLTNLERQSVNAKGG